MKKKILVLLLTLLFIIGGCRYNSQNENKSSEQSINEINTKKKKEEAEKKQKEILQKEIMKTEKLLKEKQEKERIDTDSRNSLIMVIKNVPVLHAVIVGNNPSISDVIKKDFTLKKVPIVGGDYCNKWYYKEAPNKTYFEVKQKRDRIYNIYFRVGFDYQDGSYNVDLSNNAIEREYDNFSRLSGF